MSESEPGPNGFSRMYEGFLKDTNLSAPRGSTCCVFEAAGCAGVKSASSASEPYTGFSKAPLFVPAGAGVAVISCAGPGCCVVSYAGLSKLFPSVSTMGTDIQGTGSESSLVSFPSDEFGVELFLKLGILGILGMEGMEGMLGKLLRSLSTRLGFFLATKTRATSRATITTVTPIAIPIEDATTLFMFVWQYSPFHCGGHMQRALLSSK